MVSVPDFAPIVPPESGASIMSMPCSAHCTISCCDADGSIVEVSTKAAPRAKPASNPSARPSTSRTSSCVGRHVSTTSAPCAASFGVAARTAPPATRPSAFCGVRFHTVSGKPAAKMCSAIGRPIAPKPKNATRIFAATMPFLSSSVPLRWPRSDPQCRCTSPIRPVDLCRTSRSRASHRPSGTLSETSSGSAA